MLLCVTGIATTIRPVINIRLIFALVVAQARESSLTVEIREKILKRLVENQVLGIGLERLAKDVSRAVCQETDKMDPGWCRGKCSHVELMDLIRRCVYAFDKTCKEVMQT